jgi:hypothetical protein
MPSWLIQLRDIVWSSLLAAIFALAAIVVALVAPAQSPLATVLGLNAITFALLSLRA